MKMLLPALLAVASLAPALAQNQPGTAAKPGTTVPFEELHRLIRQHLAETSDEELNAAAVNGLIQQLNPHVVLDASAASAGDTNALVARVQRYRSDFGYLRVGAVRAGLDGALKQSIDTLLTDGPLKGIVLDLRATTGTNYAAAAVAAGLFTDVEGTLLRIGAEEFSGVAGGDDVLIPVMTLMNGGTTGAAEALAAVLRGTKAGLLIGTRTAGKATLYDTFTLSNGQTIHIASKPVQLADGTTIPRAGLIPDLAITATAEEDARYLNDPYWEATPAAGTRPAPPRRRVTEADLVRQRREGISLQQIITNSADTAGSSPVLRDPALVRALDMLKALAVVEVWKQEPE